MHVMDSSSVGSYVGLQISFGLFKSLLGRHLLACTVATSRADVANGDGEWRGGAERRGEERARDETGAYAKRETGSRRRGLGILTRNREKMDHVLEPVYSLLYIPP